MSVVIVHCNELPAVSSHTNGWDVWDSVESRREMAHKLQRCHGVMNVVSYLYSNRVMSWLS